MQNDAEFKETVMNKSHVTKSTPDLCIFFQYAAGSKKINPLQISR